MTYKMNNHQARTFILLKQGLLGPSRFSGKEGIIEFIRQAGCIQFDPIDICGRNADLVLQSRVSDYRKTMLEELLYKDRILYDHFDKNLAILRIDDWPYFADIRAHYRWNSKNLEAIEPHIEEVLNEIAMKGPLCSKDLKREHKIDWYWSSTNLSRAILETLYFRGDLIIHHKKGTIKYYDLSNRYIPHEYLDDDQKKLDKSEHHKWHLKRRISAVGLLWDRPSDAYLNILSFKSKDRHAAFIGLVEQGDIIPVEVEGVPDALYVIKEDYPLLIQAMESNVKSDIVRFIAPLDSFLWDRKLIKTLFDFEYKWEIYTPADKRKYGHYTLPILFGTEFVGRIECSVDRKRKVLLVKNIWWENKALDSFTGKRRGVLDNAMQQALNKFADFNGCHEWVRMV